MKMVWMVVYITGYVAGSVGPLPPQDFQWCQEQAVLAWQELDPNLQTPDGITRNDVVYQCEFLDHRPENER